MAGETDEFCASWQPHLGLSPDLPFAFNLKAKLFRLKGRISVCEQKGNYRGKTNFHRRGGGRTWHRLNHGLLPAQGPAHVLLLQQGELGQFLLFSSLPWCP